MADNVDALKKAYEAFSGGDAESALEPFADDVVWQGSNSTELPGGGEHTGKEAVAEIFQSVGREWDEFKLTPNEFYENGDNVVVLLSSNVKKADSSAEIPAVHVARFEGGKIKRFEVLTDTLHTAEVLGLIGGKPPGESSEGS